MFVKSACEKHEERCYSNPKNKRACSYCVHLEQITVEYEKDIMYLGDSLGIGYDTETRTANAFRCNKLDKKMYPYKAERKGLPDAYPETFEDQVPMPVTCPHLNYNPFLNNPQ